MAYKSHITRPPEPVNLDAQGQIVKVPEVLARPEATKPPIMQRIMPFMMILMMGGMVSMLVINAGGIGNINPMMLMMPMMMVPMMLTMITSANNNVSLTAQIKSWLLELREARKLVHKQGAAMFSAQRTFFPQPHVLRQLVGIDIPEVASMWTIKRGEQAGLSVSPGTAQEITYNPYLAARIGLGTVLLEPQIQIDEQQITENLEPVTAVGWRSFMRTQRFVTGFPVAYNLGRAPFHRIDADDDTALSLTRAMIASLTFNHPPAELACVLITPNPDAEYWDAAKWIPHFHNPTAHATQSAPNRIYRTIADFAADSAALREGRGRFSAITSNTKTFNNPLPHVIVIIDMPDDTVTLPDSLSSGGIGGFTFLVVRAAECTITIPDTDTLFIEDQRLSTATQTDLAVADAMSVTEFDAYARALSSWRPTGYADVIDVGGPVANHRTKGYLEVLGISDIETFNPREDWEANAHGGDVRIPLGYILDDTFERTGDLQYLDFAEASIGGSGPSGALQGTTGSGKSYLLVALVLTLARYFSPERVNFILMDFKGGATFLPVAGLPHVIANITNLEQEADLLDRAQDALRGEIIRREQLLRDAGAKDLLEYRKLRKTNPHLEALPDLFIIADEFREFITLHREYIKLFESIAQTGRSLGMHLLLASQFIDASVIAEVLQNLTYGISLKVRQSSHSNTVIKNGAATSLPLGKGAAYLHKDVPDGDEPPLTSFQSFNISEPYIAPRRTENIPLRGSLSSQEAINRADGSAISLFTATDVATDSPRHALPASPEVSPDTPAPPVIADHETVSTVLARRLSEIADVSVPHQMWLPTLKAPLTVDEVTIPRANSMDQLRFRIGILDDPRNHKRVPYDIVPEDAGAHIRVAGAPGSGTSTTIEAIITAASLSYTPEQVQFYIIDCGSKLREVADFAHVGRYARRTDTEMIDRLLGEFLRMIEIRDEQFAERDVTSFSTYWESKQANPIADDPYGHMFLVIDQIHTFLSEDEDLVRRERLLRLLQNGGSRGLHVMVAGGAGSMGWHKLDPLFQLYVHHSTPDVNNSSITYRTMELKQQIKLIPHDQPGRVLALTRELQGRILLPRVGPIAQAPESTPANEVWNYKQDHGDAIRKLGQDIAARVGTRAPQINTVPAPLWNQQVWDLHESRIDHTLRPIPLGVSTDDLSLVSLPDTSTGHRSPHLIVAGDQQSGRTNMARWLLRSIVQQYTPDQAQIYLFDTTYGLLNERDVLRNNTGLLARYIPEKSAAEEALREIASIIDARRPADPELGSEEIRTRSWYSGPEIFVIADPVTELLGANTYTPGPLDALTPVLDRKDLGLHLYLTAGAAHFAKAKNSPFFAALEAVSAPTLLLSGTTTDPIFGSAMTGGTIRFGRRQPGRGQFYDPTQSHYPIIQTPLDPEWAAPQQQQQ